MVMEVLERPPAAAAFGAGEVAQAKVFRSFSSGVYVRKTPTSRPIGSLLCPACASHKQANHQHTPESTVTGTGLHRAYDTFAATAMAIVKNICAGNDN